MAKIFSAKAELTVLRGLFSKNQSIVGTLLSSIDASYFYREEALEVYDQVKIAMQEDGRPPKYKVLLEDPDLSSDAKSYLRESQVVIGSVPDAKKAVKILNKYRRRRGLHSIAHRIDSALQDNKTSLIDLEEEVSSAILQVRSHKSSSDSFLHFGKSSNSKDFVYDFLHNPRQDIIIPTGIKTYDDRNGGLIRGGRHMIAGNTSSGKSHVATSLAVSMASYGYKILVVPLEMSKHEMTGRIMANVTKTDSLSFLRSSLTEDQFESVERKFT